MPSFFKPFKQAYDVSKWGGQTLGRAARREWDKRDYQVPDFYAGVRASEDGGVRPEFRLGGSTPREGQALPVPGSAEAGRVSGQPLWRTGLEYAPAILSGLSTYERIRRENRDIAAQAEVNKANREAIVRANWINAISGQNRSRPVLEQYTPSQIGGFEQFAGVAGQVGSEMVQQSRQARTAREQQELLRLQQQGARQGLEQGALQLGTARGQLAAAADVGGQEMTQGAGVQDFMARAGDPAPGGGVGVQDFMRRALPEEELAPTGPSLTPIAGPGGERFTPGSAAEQAYKAEVSRLQRGLIGDYETKQQAAEDRELARKSQLQALEQGEVAIVNARQLGELRSAQITAAENTSASLSKKEQRDAEFKLRSQHQGLTKDYRDIAQAWVRIQAVSAVPSAAGDLALIFNFMKMLDPGSTVREGEYATAANAGGVDDNIRNLWNRLRDGERLEATREDFLNQAQRIYDNQTLQVESLGRQYRDLTVSYGGDPSRVVLDFRAVEIDPEKYLKKFQVKGAGEEAGKEGLSPDPNAQKALEILGTLPVPEQDTVLGELSKISQGAETTGRRAGEWLENLLFNLDQPRGGGFTNLGQRVSPRVKPLSYPSPKSRREILDEVFALGGGT